MIVESTTIDNNSTPPPRANRAAKSRVLIVDDHPLVCDGLIRVLSQQKIWFVAARPEPCMRPSPPPDDTGVSFPILNQHEPGFALSQISLEKT